MHPYHHALSSQHEHGGEVIDYLPLHNWFDLMWTGKSFFSRYSAPGPVPYLLQPRFAYGNHQRPRPTVSASVWISAVGGFQTFSAAAPMVENTQSWTSQPRTGVDLHGKPT